MHTGADGAWSTEKQQIVVHRVCITHTNRPRETIDYHHYLFVELLQREREGNGRLSFMGKPSVSALLHQNILAEPSWTDQLLLLWYFNGEAAARR